MNYRKEDELLGHLTIWFSRSGAKLTYSDYVLAHPALTVGYLRRALSELTKLVELDELSSEEEITLTK